MADDKKEVIAISVKNVSKTFSLPHEKQTSMKSVFLNSFKKKNFEQQEALKDVSFEVKKGDFFGIVGRNGSGKSTLLKCMAGVYTPNKGGIHINGKLVPFIELGVGFNPELSGRDNVFLNGALLGFSRKQMESMYEDIVEFAELERFMDQKLKNYSSGMQVRLAFSIAIRVKGDVLLLDEVLAVGDESFQQKCIDVFEQYKASGKTVVLVTHNMDIVEKYCNKAMLLQSGKVVDIGDSRKIAGEYSMVNTERSNVKEGSFDDDKFMQDYGVEFDIYNKNNPDKPTRRFSFGETAVINLKWQSKKIEHLGVALIKNSGEYIYGPNTIHDKVNLNSVNEINMNLKLDVMGGSYHFIIAFFGETKYDRIHLLEKGLEIKVENKDPGWSGLVKLQSYWSVHEV